MDSFTVNKIAGAVLGTCLVGMGIGLVGQAIFSPNPPKKPGYALPEGGKEAAAGGGEKKAGDELPALLAKADPKKGEGDAKICAACHNFEEGAGAKVGPDLYGVVDREKGSAPGFDYSAGMKKKGGKWTYADLNEFITKPSAYVQGTKMGFGGESSPEKRAEIIAYLRTLSKSPAPLPKVVASNEAKPAAGGAEKKDAGGGDFVKLVASSDAKKGQADAQICSACHHLNKGGGTLLGPELWGVVDRPKGSVAGFDYSAGMKKKGGNWTYDDLNQFLTKPAAYVQGTKMGFAGESSEKKRAEIVAFLRTLADKPAPLPAGGGDEKKADAGAAKPTEGAKPPEGTGEKKTADSGAKPADAKPADAKSPDTKPADAKPAEGGDKAAAGGGFATLVAAGDPTKGKADAQICSACHNLEKGGGPLVGPPLWGVVDRPKGSIQGFDYSAGMKAKGGNWTYDDLNQFLTKPAAYVQGTKMGFAGEASEKKRADIVAFLRTLADTPVPLPGK